ncbi:hypothetical protein N7G274_006039 [Stereocaulon virgatum]|uniref:Uncharacterized protein n=1 Tax=Stereocaulon virgatum TaxID=373712 RepID=A0ABR4A6K2_9LECA
MVQDQMEEDAVFYAHTIFTVQWPSLVENATEVLLIFEVAIGSKKGQISQIFTQAATMIPSAISSSLMSLRPEKVEEEVLEQDDTQGRSLKPTLYYALRIHPVLAVSLKNSSKTTDRFFDSVNKILSLPNVQVIKAHDEANIPQSLQIFSHRTLANKRKVVDEWTFRLAANGAALLFISAAAGLAVVAGPAIAFEAASAVASATGGVDGFPSSRTLTTLYSSINWGEFQNSIVSLGLTRQSLTTAVAALNVIDESFREATKSGSDLLVHLMETQKRMDDFQNLNLVLDLAAKRSDQFAVNIEKALERQDLDEIAHG